MKGFKAWVLRRRCAVCHIPPVMRKTARIRAGCRKRHKTCMLNPKSSSRPDAVHTVPLFMPALFWPHADADPDAPVVPALRTLIGRGDAGESRCDDEHAWLCERFGVQRQADWPVAPIALFGTGMPPGGGFSLRADPVHLQVNSDPLIPLAPHNLSITHAEAAFPCAAAQLPFAPHPL